MLSGMTWDHPRGYEPLDAASAEWRVRTGVDIRWDRRSLQDFEAFPVRVLAEAYDLIVIDHPHVGQATAEACLLPFENDAALRAIAAGSVGGSFESYRWQGRQWALPIDAAAQVQAYRPDRLPRPLTDWTAVMTAAAAGRIACPLRAPHALMTLFTLCGLFGRSPDSDGRVLFDAVTAPRAYDALAALARLVDPSDFECDPIAVLERLAEPGATIDAAPLTYGYASYALDEFRARRIAFADLPAIDGAIGGSALGGTGIAVSALRPNADEATAFARWVASGAVQADRYSLSGGQPGHAAAWNADPVNARYHDFYRATRRTLDSAWLRPRHDGYMAFQETGSARLDAALRGGEPAAEVIADLNRLFAETL